jgi:ssDNA-binding Zn-finger/Zn-ribbon topoisomerase 1
MLKLKIIKKGNRRPWDFGCPYCNFLRWQESEKDKNNEKR